MKTARTIARELLTSPICWTCYLALAVLFLPQFARPTAELHLIERYVLFVALMVVAALAVVALDVARQILGGVVAAARALCARTRGR